jgi:hypothetical protein
VPITAAAHLWGESLGKEGRRRRLLDVVDECLDNRRPWCLARGARGKASCAAREHGMLWLMIAIRSHLPHLGEGRLRFTWHVDLGSSSATL